MIIGDYIQLAITIVCSVLASSGFWAYIQKRGDKNDLKTQMLIGLGHDRIISLGMKYIERGYITQNEYENLYDYCTNRMKRWAATGRQNRSWRT